jgi:hypothetical protein
VEDLLEERVEPAKASAGLTFEEFVGLVDDRVAGRGK